MTRLRACLVLTLGLALLASVFAVNVQAAPDEMLFRSAQAAHRKLEDDKKAKTSRQNWIDVIELYKQVLSKHATGPEAEKSLLAIGDLYLGLYRVSRKSSDLDQAIVYYRRLTKEFSKGQLAALAQLKIGQIYHGHKKDLDRAYVELLKVELNHPQSQGLVAEARALMADIQGVAGLEQPDPPSTPAADASPGVPVSQPALINGVRHWHNPNYSRVAVDLSHEVKFRDHLLRQDPELGKPMRLYLDLEDTVIGPGVREETPIGDGLLKQARLAQYDKKTVRLVLDIQRINNYRIFSLTNPFRIVVDVMGDPPAPPVLSAKAEKMPAPPVAARPKKQPQAKVKPTPPAKPLTDLRETAQKRKKIPRGQAHVQPNKSSLARVLGLSVSKVVIDPGHGGKDHGATGVTGTREKDLTLKFAKILAAKIEKELGLEVVLTRNKDVFLPLEERTALANTKGADLFISIHANAHRSRKVHGVETYFLNLATDEEAMRVAARENATTKKNMSDLQMILSDLMLNSKITESGRLAAKVHQSMVSGVTRHYKGIRDLKVKQAPFYVLIGANMPSILVELGFLSNKTEESRLKNWKYLNYLSDGIIEGIKAYNQSIKKTI